MRIDRGPVEFRVRRLNFAFRTRATVKKHGLVKNRVSLNVCVKAKEAEGGVKLLAKN